MRSKSCDKEPVAALDSPLPLLKMGEEAHPQVVHVQRDVLICKAFTAGTKNNPVGSAGNGLWLQGEMQGKAPAGLEPANC